MNTNKTFTRLALLALGLGAACAAQAAGHIKPGQWQMDSQMTIVGMPFTPPPLSTKVCVSPQDAENDTPKNFSEDSGCKLSNMKRSDKALTADIACDGKMKGKGSFHVEYPDSTHSSGGFDFTGSVGARADTQIKQSFTSSWLGAACP